MHKAWHSIYKIGALLFSNVIHQISGSRRTKKNRQFWSELSVSKLQIQFEFTDGFEIMHKAWRSREEVPYCFPRSSIKFQGHTGWKINELNPIWVRLLGRSQLSNPSDLPCYLPNHFEILHSASRIIVVWRTQFASVHNKGMSCTQRISCAIYEGICQDLGHFTHQSSDWKCYLTVMISAL